MKHILVLSTLVDSGLQSELSEDNVKVFQKIEGLRDYIARTPIRADIMYITRDILGETVNTSLEYIIKLLQNPFLAVTEVVYLTEKDSEELISVNFMLERNKFTNWQIHTGSVNREYFLALVTGNLREGVVKVPRRAVYMVSRDDYIKSRLFSKDAMTKFQVEEDELDKVPEVEEPDLSPIRDAISSAQIVNISGLDSDARHVFTSLIAQYLSLQGKTVVIEKDMDYLSLTDLLVKSEVNVDVIYIDELYEDLEKGFKRITSLDHPLTLITDRKRLGVDYSFISNLIYNNVEKDIAYLILEKDFRELSPSSYFVTAVENELPQLLRTLEEVPIDKKGQTRFAVLNLKSYRNTQVPNTEQLKIIFGDILQKLEIPLQLFNIHSPKIGGDAHDLSMYIS